MQESKETEICWQLTVEKVNEKQSNGNGRGEEGRRGRGEASDESEGEREGRPVQWSGNPTPPHSTPAHINQSINQMRERERERARKSVMSCRVRRAAEFQEHKDPDL